MPLEGIKSVAGWLTDNKSLQILALCRNNVADAGAKDLATALKKNASLARLWLIDSKVGDAGGKAFGQAMARNKSLCSIELRLNPISQVSSRFVLSSCDANQKRAERRARGEPTDSDDDW